MYILLEGSPVSIPGLIFTDPLMCTVAPDPCEVEVVGRVGRVQDARTMDGRQARVGYKTRGLATDLNEGLRITFW